MKKVRQSQNSRLVKMLIAVCVIAAIAAVGSYLINPSKAAVTYQPTVYAEAHLMGYLWGDSAGGTRTSWQSKNGSAEVRNRFYDVAMELKRQRFPGATVTKTATNVSITNMLLSVPLDRLPAPIQTAKDTGNKAALIAFSTSVIEGEGNTNGMILDDPLLEHRNAFISVMTALGVRTEASPTKPNQGINAVRADWPIIQCWPFAAYGRVPGGAPSAGMCATTPTPPPPPPTGDTTLPTVTLTAPAAGTSVVVGANVTLSANASDNIAVTKVEFMRNSAVINTDPIAPYSIVWNTAGVAAGTYNIAARASDATGNTRTTASRSITLTSPPITPGNGDANGDGRVNALDLSLLLSRDGQNYPAADFNRDGIVGSADLAILLSRWTW